jgi:predicted permease
MPDWNAYVRERLDLQGIRPECEQNVIDDLAGQFEEAYSDAIASGLSDAEATTAAMAHVTDWRELARQIAQSRRLAAPVIDRLSIRAGDAAIEARPRGWFLAELAQSLRVTARLRRHPGYVVMSTFVLAVSIGINLLVFTVVNALWIRPLPFPEPERVVTILNELGGSIKAAARIFEGGAAGQVMTTDTNAGLRPQIEIAGQVPETLCVTSGYFRVLGLTIRGRDFTPEEEQDGAEPVAIVSDRLWSRALARRADVIGAVLPAKPLPIRVIGIAPPGFEGARRGERADLWIPTGLVRRLAPADWKGNSLPLMVFARLGPSQTASMVERRYREVYPPGYLDRLSKISPDLLPTVTPLTEVYGTPETRTLMIHEGNAFLVVSGLAMLVLLAGCATLAALILVHYERRRPEFALKIALGAERWRLVFELARELTWVGVVGSASGILVAILGSRLVPALGLPGGVDIGRLDLSIDWRVCAVAIIATALTLLVAAARPVLRSTHLRLAGEILSGPSMTSLALHRVRQTLLAFQVCATIVVLVAAGLFVRAVNYGFGNAPGFDVDRTVFVSVQEGSPAARAYVDRNALIIERAARLTSALRELPGVSVVAEGISPIGPDASSILIVPNTVKVQDREYQLRVGRLTGSPELLSALGVPILTGRPLTTADVEPVPHPTVITRSLAERLWPDGGALGQTLRMPQLRGGPYVVVGIARDLKFGSLAQPGSGVVVTAGLGNSTIVSNFVIRTDHPGMVVGMVRRTIKGEVVRVATGREVVARDIGRQRLGAWFFSGFGLAALLLGVGGAFGLVAYLAESRRREFGIRLALGADMSHLVRRGLAAALAPVSAGVAAGLILAGIVSQVFEAFLVGISALDPVSYLLVALTMLSTTTIAALAAAWRLRRTNPSDALRAT